MTPSSDSHNNYNFKDAQTSARSLIPLIALHGENLVGAEIGVCRADNFLTLLHNCPNIKTLYGVDSYKPYVDFLVPGSVNQREADECKAIAELRRKYSGCEEKIIFYEEDSIAAAERIEDESLDFVFLDAYLSYEQVVRELFAWYPKVKNGGLVSGHDWVCEDVQLAVRQFRDKLKIEDKFSTYDNVWAWSRYR